ncbi:hypothetical protein [Clostridium sp. UBA7503]|uniref:hypothetical protein n=1 Tax=Clostridium sp. UBA7503 TaxID=1946377 RepID=UPI003217ED4E
MAQRGRKPKPTAVKEFEGNPEKRALNELEPKPKKKAPKCPTWLDAEAKKEWRRVPKQLEEFGLTPSSRSRIVADKGSNDCLDPMEMMLRGEMK